MLAEFEAVSALEAQLDSLKESLMRALRDLRKAAPGDTARDALIHVHGAAIKYFSGGERYAHHCVILEASKNPSWLRGVAEYCYAILESVTFYHRTIRTECQAQGADYTQFVPVQFSYSCMQRLVYSHLPMLHTQTLMARFTEQGLPVDGFAAHDPMQADQSTQPGVAIPRARQIRNRIERAFRTIDDLMAFLIDYFPAINKNLGSQFNRTAIINELLRSHGENEIEAALDKDAAARQQAT